MDTSSTQQERPIFSNSQSLSPVLEHLDVGNGTVIEPGRRYFIEDMHGDQFRGVVTEIRHFLEPKKGFDGEVQNVYYLAIKDELKNENPKNIHPKYGAPIVPDVIRFSNLAEIVSCELLLPLEVEQASGIYNLREKAQANFPELADNDPMKYPLSASSLDETLANREIQYKLEESAGVSSLSIYLNNGDSVKTDPKTGKTFASVQEGLSIRTFVLPKETKFNLRDGKLTIFGEQHELAAYVNRLIVDDLTDENLVRTTKILIGQEIKQQNLKLGDLIMCVDNRKIRKGEITMIGPNFFGILSTNGSKEILDFNNIPYLSVERRSSSRASSYQLQEA